MIADGAIFTSVDTLEEISFEMLSMRLPVSEKLPLRERERIPNGILLLSDAADPDGGTPE